MNEEMVQFRTCLSSEVESKTIVKGSIILCSDSGEFYYDNLEGERILVAKSIVYLNTDEDRTGLLIPEAGVMYVVISTGMLWIFTTTWVCLTTPNASYFDIDNVEIPTGSTGLTITDDRINSKCTATFNSIPALNDLATADGVSTTCTCNDGNIVVKTTCTYPLIGSIKVIKP